LLLTALFVEVLCISCLAFFIFYPGNKPQGTADLDNKTPEIAEIMEIVKKSPDYPDFLKVIKSSDFDAELVEYYNFSPEVYAQKMAEWESSSNDMKEYKVAFDTITLNSNSYLVLLKSKSNPGNGLLAILDMGKKEPQVIVANMAIEVGVGL